jgi:ABC-type sugar transport system ATPase subunit
MWDYAGPLGLTRWQRLRAAAQKLLDEIGSGMSVEQNVSDLDLGQLKVLEIARALSYQPRVLLLDESTAFFNTQEMNALFAVMKNLRAQGIAIGYISHHLDEVERIADTITILKDGQRVGDYGRGELTNEQIEARMVGREIGRGIYPEERVFAINGGGPVLALEHISVPGRLRDVSLNLYRGEILGIGGLKGAGGESLLGVIVGDVPAASGRMLFRNQPYAPRKPFDAWAQGVAYLPGDRTREGLIMDFSVQDNLSMAAIPRRGPFVHRAGERALVDRLVPMLQIKAASPAVTASSLSGGNLQKVVLGKCIAPEPQVLLLDNPTRGIDVGARMQIYATIRALAEAGVSVILLSEDLPELIGMSDRVVLMRKGAISKEFAHTEFPSEEEIIGHII